jgi:hypothetical protein
MEALTGTWSFQSIAENKTEIPQAARIFTAKLQKNFNICVI